MTEQNTHSAEEMKGRRPSNRLWLVQGEGAEATWTEITALWPTKSANGLAGNLTGQLPITNPRVPSRLVVLPAKFKDESGDANQEAAQ